MFEWKYLKCQTTQKYCLYQTSRTLKQNLLQFPTITWQKKSLGLLSRESCLFSEADLIPFKSSEGRDCITEDWDLVATIILQIICKLFAHNVLHPFTWQLSFNSVEKCSCPFSTSGQISYIWNNKLIFKSEMNLTKILF